jgi:hypothetical protein
MRGPARRKAGEAARKNGPGYDAIRQYPERKYIFEVKLGVRRVAYRETACGG